MLALPSRILPLTLVTAATALLVTSSAWGAESPPAAANGKTHEALLKRGEAIYQETCAVCHGDHGQGVEESHKEPLQVDSPLAALADLIAQTMPEDDPETCVGADAAAVATYILRQFHVDAARGPAAAPRVVLARLTAAQLRQSLADLYASPGRVAWKAEPRGVRGFYFDGAGWNNENKIFERLDPVIDFDFGHQGPGDGIQPEAFYIQWRGGMKADVTGGYELVVRSTCAFMCYFGAERRKFIDNHVQSGDKTEFRRSIVLTAGRVYPFRLELFQRKRKTEQPPAKISLAWKPPFGAEQIVPPRQLVDVVPPATFSLQAKLPPDDRSYGYERGITVDRQWDESTTAAALEFAQIASDELWPEYRRRHGQDSDEHRARLRGFLAEIVRTAFRGPLDDGLGKLYIDDQVDAAEDDAEAIRRALLIALKSPRFLYPTLDHDRKPPRRIANRLALVLFDSLPVDAWLLKLAAGEQLKTDAQIRAAARRMVFDERARSKTRACLYAWLNLAAADDLVKDDALFAGFDAELVGDLRASLDRFLDEVVWSGTSDYRQLFQAEWAYTTQRLAAFYGPAWKPALPGGAGLQRSVLDPEHRQGVLTHPYLMSRLAYFKTTSPIHRGVFLIRYLVGRTLRPPGKAFTPFSPDLHPDLTTRQRVALQTSPENCQVCHVKINGLGFTLENFDAVGRYRETERRKPIDSTGSYTTRAGQLVDLRGPRELADLLATSDDAQQAFVRRAFQHFVKQPPAAFGAGTLDRLTAGFRRSGCNIRQLLVEIAVVGAGDGRTARQEVATEADDAKKSKGPDG